MPRVKRDVVAEVRASLALSKQPPIMRFDPDLDRVVPATQRDYDMVYARAFDLRQKLDKALDIMRLNGLYL